MLTHLPNLPSGPSLAPSPVPVLQSPFRLRGVKSGISSLRSSILRAKHAFTLIEVALALGIVSFAIIPVMGLLPLGLTSFKQAMDNTVTTLIVQRLVNEAQQTDFKSLANTTYYFDNQGTMVSSGNPYVYVVTVTVNNPTAIPTDGSTGALVNANAANLATLTLNITQNNQALSSLTASALVARTTIN